MTRLYSDSQDHADERRNRAEPISQAGGLAAQAFARAGFSDPTLVLRWREIVGADVARVAQPFKLSQSPAGGVLTLKAEPAASVFLQHQTRMLCERINAYLGRSAVVRLRFVQGAVPIRQQPSPCPARLPDPPPTDPVYRFSGPDPLKAALTGLARARSRPTRD